MFLFKKKKKNLLQMMEDAALMMVATVPELGWVLIYDDKMLL